MEIWQLDFEWLRVQHTVKEALKGDKLPDLQAILLLIGIQELGLIRTRYTKEEKQDLMHIAVCHLLSSDGYFELSGRDEDGWPHYRLMKSLPKEDMAAQEMLLKSKIVTYFATSPILN